MSWIVRSTVESTLAPRTMQDLVLPLPEDSNKMLFNKGFYLWHCPERVMPSNLLSNLKNVSHFVGGMTPETTETMVGLYKRIVTANQDPTDCLTAELVNKSPGRQKHLPGGGVGGHCIPKDPWLLAYSANENHTPIRLIPAARLVNDSMPLHVADLVQQALEENGKSLAGAKILIMGYAYLENSDDIRNSPSMFLERRLRELGAEVAVHDPYVSEYRGDLLVKAEGCDAAVIMVKHGEYQLTNNNLLLLALKSPILIDARNLMTSEMNLGSEYPIFVLGRAEWRSTIWYYRENCGKADYSRRHIFVGNEQVSRQKEL